jgi:dopamine D1-like receptor
MYHTLYPGPPPEWKCLFTEDLGYLIFSSTVSFYGPLLVMVFTYIRIFQVLMAHAH